MKFLTRVVYLLTVSFPHNRKSILKTTYLVQQYIYYASHGVVIKTCYSMLFKIDLVFQNVALFALQVKLETPTVKGLYYWQGPCSEFCC